ncbi:MAG: ABC transporter permease [Spirochaetae bacterium HGW-Spirochaetae-7]|jgi:ABC-type multidrug transport system permease subunit|nr:MAG: ABC transporter permease [Spirochaetae bacterium HGW-Spirochaetae-7]
MLIRQFIALFKARTMEFVRDRGTFFWNLLFPVFLVLGMAFAFSGGDEKLYKVGVVGTPDASVAMLGLEQVQSIAYADAGEARQKLERHQVDFVIDFDASSFMINEESNKGRFLRTLFIAQQGATARAGGTGSRVFTELAVSGRATRYVDWLVPGVIGMNMMFSSLFGVGYVLVRYRKNGVLKRLKATPVHALNFVGAQAASRLVIVLLTSVFVYSGTNMFLHFMMRGHYLDLLILTTLGILCMISLGLVFASRMRSEELAGGILNLITFPMLALSGVFFSLEGSPAILKTVSRAFPLTHFTEAARKIMIDGAGLAQIMPNLAVLAGLTVVFLVLSSILFKWE